MQEFCKNHPTTEAKRSCYYCKESICSDCQQTISHHIFCSRKCYYKHLFQSAVTKVKEIYEKVEKKVVRFWKALKSEPGFLVVFSILFLGLILSIILSFININYAKRLNNSLNQLRQTVVFQDTTKSAEEIAKHIDTLTVFTPPANAMVIRNKIDIEGEAEENRVITLSADGELIQVTLVKGGTFAFNDVQTTPGDNHFIVRSMDEDGSSVILEEIEFKYGAPTPSFLARDFTRGSLSEKKIAVTFDGDYLDNITAEILDALKQENVRCTMFLTGRFIRRYGDQIKRILEDGHEVGNHSWTHPHLTTYEQNRRHQTRQGVTREIVQEELLKTAELFFQLTGQRMKPYWRAPYGEHNLEIRQWAAEVGYRQIGWTVGRDWSRGMDTLDWVADTSASYYYSAEEIAQKILTFGADSNEGANGAVILMHLGSLRNGDYPHEKLPYIIREMKKKGYSFVTISELLL